MSGEVSIQPGGVNEWIAAPQNRPLTSADRVWTDKESRSELSLGTASIRMNSETSLTLTNVSDGSVQLQLDQGTLSVTVFRLFKGEIYEVDTPNVAFTIMKAGEYRFDVLPDADTTWVTVRKGHGEATGEGTAVRVNDGERVKFVGGASLAHTAESAPDRDGFEDWIKVRNQREEGSVSARYVAPGVIGYEDLDTYGTWRMAPDYGYVWYPSATAIAPGWAPYRYGHWAWVEPWGWTWVDNAVWGFAPYHYGRWIWAGGTWGWCPGPIGYARPIYAPALVGWYGGPRFGVGLSFGVGLGVGWFPLGFGEPFVPWYHVGPGYYRSVNISNTRITNVNVTNITYVNRSVAGAVTATSTASFAAGHNLATAGVAVPASALQHGEVMRTVQVAPVRASVLGGHAPLTNGAPPTRVSSRTVVTNQTPPARPVSFEAKQAALSKNNGMPLDHATLNNLRVQQQTATHGPTGTGASGSTAGGGAGTGTRTVPRPPGPGTKGTVYENSGGGGGGSVTGNGVVTGNTVPRPPNSTTGNKTQSTGTSTSTNTTTNTGGKNSSTPELKRTPTTQEKPPKPPKEAKPKPEHQEGHKSRDSAAVHSGGHAGGKG
jgi:hypothetical protein